MPNHAYNLLNIHIVILNRHTPSTEKRIKKEKFQHVFQLCRDGPSLVEPVLSSGLPWLNQYLARINVLAQGHNAVTPVRLEPMAPGS